MREPNIIEMREQERDKLRAESKKTSNGAAPGVPKILSFADIPSIFSFEGRKIEYLVEGLLPARSVTAFTGKPGAGKSTFVLSMASAIERGVSFAGMATQRRPVLILDRENPVEVIIERYRRFGITDSETFRHWGKWWERPPDPASSLITAFVMNTNPKPLIVIDSMVGFYIGDENDSAKMRAHMEVYGNLANLGATIIPLHHTGKGANTQDYRGSSDFEASLDNGFTVTNISPGQILEAVRVKAFKTRFTVNSEMVFRFRDDGFYLDECTPGQTNIKVLREILMANPRVSEKDFLRFSADKKIPRQTAREFLKCGIKERSIDMEVGPDNAHLHSCPDNAHLHSWLGQPKDA